MFDLYALFLDALFSGENAGKGVFRECLAYCMSRISNIRIDTHKDNIPMQKMLEKNGFLQCGTIRLSDGSPRLAYQKTEPVS